MSLSLLRSMAQMSWFTRAYHCEACARALGELVLPLKISMLGAVAPPLL